MHGNKSFAQRPPCIYSGYVGIMDNTTETTMMVHIYIYMWVLECIYQYHIRHKLFFGGSPWKLQPEFSEIETSCRGSYP